MSATGNKPGILFVDLGATFGGAEIYLLDLLPSLRNDVRCLVLCCNPEFQARLKAEGVRYHAIFCGTGVLKPVQLLWAVCLTGYLMLRENLRILQINGYSEILLVPLARLLGRQAIPTRHLSFDIEVRHWWQAPGRFMARSLYRRLARLATRIVCVSAAVGHEVEALAPGRVRVIPNWVQNIPPFHIREPRSPFTVLYTGRLVEYKGLQVLLKAVRLAQPEIDRLAVKVVVVGDGPFRPELERLAAGLPVEFVGFQRDVSTFYESADLFVSSSLGPEGSSLVTLEAMAHGLPCLMSDLPVHREIAHEGAIAKLFRNGDAYDLANKLLNLIQNRPAREQLSRLGYEAVCAAHSQASATRAYLETFTA